MPPLIHDCGDSVAFDPIDLKNIKLDAHEDDEWVPKTSLSRSFRRTLSSHPQYSRPSGPEPMLNISKFATSTPANTTQPCHLLSLPYDIRKMIWDICLVVEGGIKLVINGDDKRGPSDPPKRAPIEYIDTPSLRAIRSCSPVVRSCRQIYAESIGLLYGSNQFFVDVSHRSG